MDKKYNEIIDWLFNQVPMFQNIGVGAYKPGLETVTRLSEAFDSPHKKLRCIHVGGTNGKGSTASTIAAILTASGYRTALYTSPHLVDFRERIRIDGEMIPKDDVVDFIEKYKSLNFQPQPSFFELTTIMAFDYFARNDVDYAVIEVGLGGRLDATNIITPFRSIITNISLDHTSLLGDTPVQIAVEKAGIIKPGVLTVIGNAEGGVRKVFERTALEKGTDIIFAQDNEPLEFERHSDYILYKNTRWGDVKSELVGDCQPENARTVFTAIASMDDLISAKAVRDGFANVSTMTGLMGRWTTVKTTPRVICDTGHNPGGWQYIAPRLEKIAEEGDLHIVIGFVNDKDVEAIFKFLPRKARYYFATPSVSRGRDSQTLLSLARQYDLDSRAYHSVAEAYHSAESDAKSEDIIFVGGSTFIVADFLQI